MGERSSGGTSRRDGWPSRLIAVASGKSRVGKTTLAYHLAAALREAGYEVCYLETTKDDRATSDLQTPLARLISGSISLAEATTAGPAGLPKIRGAETDVEDRLDQLATCLAPFDFTVVDTPTAAGAARIAGAHKMVIILAEEAEAIADTFTLLKSLQAGALAGPISVVVNLLAEGQNPRQLFEGFSAAARRRLGLELCYLGAVPFDKALESTSDAGTPAGGGRQHPSTSAAIAHIAKRLAAASTMPAATPEQTAESTGDAALPTLERDEGLGASAGAHQADRAERSVHELTEEVIKALATQCDESEARQLLGAIERAFAKRFRRRSSDLKATLYEALLNEALSLAEQRELIEALLADYQRRPNALPILPASNLAASTTSPAILAANIATLAESCEQDSGLAQQLFTACLPKALRGSDWTSDQSRNVLEALQHAHEQRFAEPLNASEADGPTANQIAEWIQRQAQGTQALREQIAELERQHTLLARLAGIDSPPNPRR